MTVTRTYYTGVELLAFKAIATSFRSDPDIYISTNSSNQYPSNSSNSQIYCEQKGSDTCILQSGQFSVGQTIYIGIKCDVDCSYSLTTWYSPISTLPQTGSRTQYRFNANSTQIFQYTIPAKVSNSPTISIEITIEPENDYSFLESFVIFDQSFYIQQQQASELITKTGNAIKINSNQYQWCSSCTIYIIINVQNDQRYYITTTPRGANDALSSTLPTNVLVSPFTQECYSYFVTTASNDLRFDVEGFTGQADLYVTAGTAAVSPNDTSILLRAVQGPQRGIVLSSADRKSFGQPSGAYYVCFYAYTPFSGQITTTEAVLGLSLDTITNQIRTSILQGSSYIYSKFTDSNLNQKGTISIYVEAQGLSVGQNPPLVNYKVCNSTSYSSCSMKSSDLNNMYYFSQQNTMLNLYSSLATINHDPSVCPDPNSQCTYMFAFQNQISSQKSVSVRIGYQYNNPGNVLVNQVYVNKISQGNYISYKIDPSQNTQMAYFKSLKIQLYSTRGDGDLFVSFDDPNPSYDTAIFQCRLNDEYEEILITQENGWETIFLTPIYFSIYANTYTQIQISFSNVYQPVYDQNTESAQPLADKQSIYEILPDENSVKAYSYQPWWSGKENRTVVFFADVVVNDVIFYAALNQFPNHFLTSFTDLNDSIVIYGSNRQYYSFNGTYYIQLLPNFQLSGLISKLQYVYIMHAFSMTPAAQTSETAYAYETMELDYLYDGLTNQSLYQDYRFFQMDMSATYNISLQRYPGQGYPIFLVSIIDSNYGLSPRLTNYAFKSQLTPGFQTRQNLTLTSTNRTSRNPRCGTVFQSLQGDGSFTCFLAISVTCNTTSQCVYQLKINQIGNDNTILRYSSNSQSIYPLMPPMPILTRDYVNGFVNGTGVIKYYYFPVNYQTMGGATILLTKTSYQQTKKNGDSRLIVNIQNNILDPTSGFNYTNWNYPTDQNFGRQSSTGDNQQVEIVDVCRKSLNESCNSTKGCGVIVGVVGNSNTLSNYRIKGFYETNKLRENHPIFINQQINPSGSFDYYWFIITEGINNQSAWFDYYITVNSNTTGDKDLYVSLMDGREPNELDYDLTSQMQGADIINIAWNSTIWIEKNWNISSGVIVVVGVRLYQQTNYTVILAKAPDPSSPFLAMQRLNIGQQLQISLPDISSSQSQRNYTQMYMIYNWQQFDFAFTVTMQQGNATLQYGKTGQLDQSNNLFSAIPFNKNNSEQYFNITQGNYQSVQIIGNTCYNCWYFIRIDITSPYIMQFQVTASQSNSVQGQFMEIFNGQPQQLYMNAGQTQQLKFILDSKDGWQLQGVIANGQVNVYIGLDPNNVGPQKYIWTSSGQAGQSSIISVLQIDPNFYFGAYYFVSVVSSQNSNTVATFTLVQTRTVLFIGNNHDYTYSLNPANLYGDLPSKVTLYTARELVKFHVFNVPGVSSGQPVYHQVNITITLLDPNVFPVLYLNKVEMSSQPQYVNMLNFPNINSYQIAFGENPFFQLNSHVIVYSFYGVAQQQWTQYTMAVYVYNWGLTNQKKNEYQIEVDVNIVSQCVAVQCDSNGNPIVQSTQAKFVRQSRPINNSSQGFIQSLVSNAKHSDLQANQLIQ